MTNPTTPFSWQMPTATDLVTDLPADFETFGQAVATSMADLLGGTTGQILSKASNTDMDFTWITNDVGDITAVTAGTGISGGGTSGAVTITNSMATEISAAGDIIVGTGSATFDNLPIGTTGQVLTADTTVSPYKVKWATPSAGTSGMTLIARTSFSNVASQAFDSVFNTTYSNYLVVIDQIYAVTGDDDLHLQMRYAGPTTQTTTYYGSAAQWSVAGTPSTIASNNAAQWTISGQTGSSGTFGSGHIFFNVVGDASKAPVIRGQFTDKDANQLVFGGNQDTARVYTGFLLKSSSTNITGTVSIYGMAKS